MEKKHVLITGASSGIGYSLAKIFSKNGYSLILIAQNKEKLELAAKNFPDDTITFPIDLANEESAEQVYNFVKEKGIHIDILVNNAGFGVFGDYLDANLGKEVSMMHVNMITLSKLTHYFARPMVKKGEGNILNVASVAAYMPGPYFAVYHATKAYVLSFSEALSYELNDTGVKVSVLCPGPTKTNFDQTSSINQTDLFKGPLIMKSDEVAQIGYEGMVQGKKVIIPGLINKLQVIGVKLTPKALIGRIMMRIYKAN